MPRLNYKNYFILFCVPVIVVFSSWGSGGIIALLETQLKVIIKNYCLVFLYPLLSLETSAALRSQDALWPGSYELQVEVLDAQGLSCPTNEIFRVDVCTCVETKHCSLRSARLGTTSSELSAPAIGLLLMTGFLLLCKLKFNKTHYYTLSMHHQNI